MEHQFSKTELKKISVSFRDAASRLIRSDIDDIDGNLKRFLHYMHETPFMQDFITGFNQFQFSIKEDIGRKSYHSLLPIPTNPKEEYAYVYQLMVHLSTIKDGVMSISQGYGEGNKLRDHSSGFLRRVFQPLVNYIAAFIGNIMIDMGDEEDKRYSININANNSNGVSVAIDRSSAKSHVDNSVVSYSAQVREQGEKIVSRLELESGLSDEDREYIEHYVKYFIQQSTLDKTNIRIGQRYYKELMGYVDAAKMTSEMVGIFGVFGPLILQLIKG